PSIHYYAYLLLFCLLFLFFFYTYPPAFDIYTLSLHDALPIYKIAEVAIFLGILIGGYSDGYLILLAVTLSLLVSYTRARAESLGDRKSTRLNSSHGSISYAVFCLKKKKKHEIPNLLLFRSP